MKGPVKRAARRKFFGALFLLMTTCGHWGCSAGRLETSLPADEALARLPALQERAVQAPDDAKAQADLGLALQALSRNDEAVGPLETALRLDPSQTGAALALAGIHAEAGRLEEASAVYRSARPANKDEARLIEAGAEQIERQLLSRKMRALAAQEQEIRPAEFPLNTVAVHAFATDRLPDEMQPMGKATAAVMMTELNRFPELKLVERRHLQVLLDELELQRGQVEPPRMPVGLLDDPSTGRGLQQRLSLLIAKSDGLPYYNGIIDGLPGPQTKRAVERFQRDSGLAADGVAGPRTRAALDEALAAQAAAGPREGEEDGTLRAGRLLGARFLIGGTLAAQDGERLTASAEIVNSLSGETAAGFITEATVDEFYMIPRRLVLQSAEALDVDITPEERKRILDLPPATRSLAAYLAFGRGVEHEDEGRWEKAAEAYGEAVRLDPRFAQARDRVEVLKIGSASFRNMIDRATRAALQVRRQATGAMSRALGAVGTGLADSEMRNDGDLSRAPQADNSPIGTVRVQGQVPVGRP
jgi:peptidoglycan hydrolase-like protein with peptidoglycan-binding domain